MWLPAVELNRRFHSDVPFLQDRDSQGREGPEQFTAVQVPTVRQTIHGAA
jgi:hypothetical protein